MALTWIDVWNKVGNMPLRAAKNENAKILIGNGEYTISDVKYQDGQLCALVVDVWESGDNGNKLLHDDKEQGFSREVLSL